MSAFGKSISSILLRLWGWKIIGGIPDELRKSVIAVVPHTSAWDFPLGLLTRAFLQKDIKYVGKKELFTFPKKRLLLSLGGYPVDRSKSNNFVDAVVDIFNQHDDFHLSFAPEGTRKKVEKLKSGFYHIARLAKVPILLVTIDAIKKEVTFREVFHPTANTEEDMAYFMTVFSGYEGFKRGRGLGALRDI